MGDLIDRQTAIEMALIEANKPGAYGYIDAKSMVDLLNKLPTEQHWIPCNERMPEEYASDQYINGSDVVLVTVDAEEELTTDVSYTVCGEWAYGWRLDPPEGRVIAWMPLPEPYEEEDAGDD